MSSMDVKKRPLLTFTCLLCKNYGMNVVEEVGQ
jgi:hypothetical protein